MSREPDMSARNSGFRRKQAIVVAQGLAAMLVIFLLCTRARLLFAALLPESDDLASRLAFAVRWLLAPGCMLLVGIVVAGRRGFYPEAIDGTRTPANHGLEIGLRFNQNTLEQTVLAAIAWLGLALSAPHANLAFIPAMACLFVVGRLTFWFGYLVYPTARAFGMVLTVLPTIVTYGWLLAHCARASAH